MLLTELGSIQELAMARILLVDDDADLSRYLQLALEERGHLVEYQERAERGPDTLAGGEFDLVLLDNKMPGMSGIDFLAALQQRSIHVPVILMTGHTTTATTIQAMNLGAFDYIIKPMDYGELYRELEQLIAAALRITRPVLDVQVKGDAIADDSSAPVLLGTSKPMLEVYKLIGRFAKYDDAVLILGETGTGKELVSQAIHSNSPRKHKPFVALNCTALNENLLDDELFGHEPGAFTNAAKLRKGKFEHAHGGTLFLDEVGDMPLSLQAKLLRVLENQEICRIGSNEVIRVDVRLVSATHRDLESAIRAGHFRQDLYFRLKGLTITLPPLRVREGDVELLAKHFLARAARDLVEVIPTLHESALAKLCAYSWPGNVRELRHIAYSALGMCRGNQILPAHLDFRMKEIGGQPLDGSGEGQARADLTRAICWAWNTGQPKVYSLLHDLMERELLRVALAEMGGNQSQVAERLGIARGTVITRMQKYGLK
jgi:DNA-binding NtrC family response regulator